MKYDTEYIDKYLNGELSESEAKTFEEKMKADKDFAYEVELQDAAIQAIQYPKFVNKMNNIYKRIREDDPPVKEKQPTPVVEMKPKPPYNLRWLVAVAASLLLIILAYFLLPKQTANPIAAITQELTEKAMSNTKGDDAPPSMSLYQESVKLFKNGEYKSAIKSFDQVIQEDEDKRAAAKLFKADALHRLDRKDEVRAVLESIDENAPLYQKAQKVIKKYR